MPGAVPLQAPARSSLVSPFPLCPSFTKRDLVLTQQLPAAESTESRCCLLTSNPGESCETRRCSLRLCMCVCGGSWGIPTLSPTNMPQLHHAWCQESLSGEVRAEGAYLRQAGDEEVSALKGGRRLLQEAKSLRKVPKSKFVNKGDICVNLKLDSTDHEPDFGLLEPRLQKTRGEGIPGLRVERKDLREGCARLVPTRCEPRS